VIASMLAAERLAIEAACTWPAHAFCQFSDRNDYEGYQGIFTADAVFSRPDAECRTAAVIAAALKSRPSYAAVRHVCANPMITVIDSTHARGTGTLLVYRHNSETNITDPPVIGDYEDAYAFTELGWQIASRRVWLSFGPHRDSRSE
jgi:SnoaL-like domain